MRRFRSIQTEYVPNAWEDGLTKKDAYVELFGLMLSPLLGLAGIAIMTSEDIADRIEMKEKEVSEALDNLEKKHKRIKRYRGGWLWHIGTWKYESNSDKVYKALYKILDTVPKKLKADFYDKYPDTVDDKVSDKVSDSLPQQVLSSKGQGSRKKGKEKSLKSEESDKKDSAPEVAAKYNPVSRWCDIWFEAFRENFIVVDADAGHINKAFKALKRDEADFESRVRGCFSDKWFAENKPGAAYFYRSLNKFTGHKSEPQEPEGMMKFLVDDESTWPQNKG